MSDENEIVLVKTSSGELVEAGTTKLDLIENKLSEVEVNLTELSESSNLAVKELVNLAIASQNPQYYEALAKLISAAAKANHETVVAITAKADLYREHKKEKESADGFDDEDNPTSVTNITNNLVMTSTEAIRAIMEAKKNGN